MEDVVYWYMFLYIPNIYLYSDVDHYLSICEKVINEHGQMDQTIMHCIFLGAAGVGKSSLMKRLLHMQLDSTRTSTPLAKKSVRVQVRNVATTVAKVSGLDWQRMDDVDTQACELMEQMVTKQENKPKKEIEKGGLEKEQMSTKQNEEFKKKNQNDCEGNKTSEVAHKQTTGQIRQSPVKQEQVSRKDTAVSGSAKQVHQTKHEGEVDGSQTTDTHSNELASKNQPFHFSTIDFFQQVLKEKGVSGLKPHISKLKPWTLYLTDSGGQPEFQELLPAIVEGPCVFFVVLPLHKEMMEKYKVEYVRSDQCMKTYISSFSLQEDLMRSLASIAATKCEDKDGNKVTPMVMLVATFVDQVPEKNRQKKLDYIKALVKKTDAYRLKMIVEASESQMVFTINNISDEESKSDAQKIRDAFQNLAQHFEVPTPYPWLVFSILVQHIHGHESVISKEDCFEVAQKCGIHSKEDYLAALQFLHKQTGVLHYYNKPSDLSRIVIRDPQHLFSRVNNLVQETFVFGKVPFGKCREDFQKGIFTKKDYEVLTEDSEVLTKDSSSKLTPSMLLNLLEYLKVVVPLGDEKYFMPCAIAHLDEAKSSHLDQPGTVPPLLITFKSGYCPKGLFGTLVACIVKKQVAHCELNLDESEIHRNQICFQMGLDELLLRFNSTYIDIELRTEKSFSLYLCTLCNNIRKFIEENTRKSCVTLCYSVNYSLSFVCQCDQTETYHLAVKKPEGEGHFFWCTSSKREACINQKCHMWLPEVRRNYTSMVFYAIKYMLL